MSVTTDDATVEAIGARPIPEFAGVREVWPRGRRLDAVREAATAYKERFAAQGTVRAARSVDIAAAPYPTVFAFHGAATAPHVPMVSIVNRMIAVQYEDFEGRFRTLLFEPTEPDGSAQAPFYRHLQAVADRVPGGSRLTEALLLKYYNDPGQGLASLGLQPDEVDYLTFDHLHVQDPRMILGSTTPLPGESEPREPRFGGARLLVHHRETATLESLHPMQWAWYVEGGLDGVPESSLLRFDGDLELGIGISLVRSPGHTDGNHTLVINTPDGVWVSSENGVAADNWQPERSRIPGVARYAKTYNREVVPNANTLEDSLDQYDSMVMEKILADPSTRDPRWLQILPSSELAPWRRLWPVRPSFFHGGLAHGTITRP